MARFRSARERRLWLAVTAAVVALFAALYPLQFVLDALRERSLLRGAIAALFVVCAMAVVGALVRRRAPPVAWLILAIAGALYAAFALAMEVPQERLHLVEYGALALLLRVALAESVAIRAPGSPRWSVDVWTLGTATAIGWLDEAMQGVLPNRIYDLRDVVFNALAAGLALGAAAAMRSAMIRSKRSQERGGE